MWIVHKASIIHNAYTFGKVYTGLTCPLLEGHVCEFLDDSFVPGDTSILARASNSLCKFSHIERSC